MKFQEREFVLGEVQACEVKVMSLVTLTTSVKA